MKYQTLLQNTAITIVSYIFSDNAYLNSAMYDNNTMHSQILWSKEFADAILNSEGKSPLLLAVEKGHVK